MLNLSRFYEIGTQNQSHSNANKIRITNIIGLFTTVVSGLYTLTYFFVLDHFVVASINLAFTIAYALTLTFNRFHAFRGSKIWFFSVLMVHLFVCTNIYVTNASGFHLYYFLVPTGVYLLFALNERVEKLTLSSIAVVLFFYCENTLNTDPLILLTDELNNLIYQSVIFVNMIEVMLVMTLFTNEIESNEAKLTKQATTDALTGIDNRHSFFERGSLVYNTAVELNRPCTIMLMDFDHFKSINDKYGHFVGDVCLVEVCKLVKENCREADIFARIGGEEFALIFPDTTLSEANLVAEKLRDTIEMHPIHITEANSLNCTVSMGLAAKQSNNDNLNELLVRADKALYIAKTKGRNRVQQFDAA